MLAKIKNNGPGFVEVYKPWTVFSFYYTLFAYDFCAKGEQCQLGKFKVLHTKRNTDNGYAEDET